MASRLAARALPDCSVYEHEHLLGLMVEAVQDYAIYMLDPSGLVMSWNAGAVRNKGYRADEIVGRNYAQFFTAEARAAGEPQQQLADASQKGRVHREGWRVRKDGSLFWADVTLTAVRDAAGDLLGFAKVTHDLTDRQAMAEALRIAKDQAIAANAAKSDFLANMSHELRTPLNAIIGFSEVMMGEVLGPQTAEKNQEYAHHIYDSGLHLLTLINDVLDIAKLDAKAVTLNYESVLLSHSVAEAFQVVQGQADRAAVRLVAEVEAGLRLRCDGRRLHQILLNLLSNAIKFTGAGGRVHVSARRGKDGVRLVVDDTGVGIAAEDIPRALSRFGQVGTPSSKRHQGTGLGLPLVQQLVDLHGGSFRLESQAGVGTRATISFP